MNFCGFHLNLHSLLNTIYCVYCVSVTPTRVLMCISDLLLTDRTPHSPFFEKKILYLLNSFFYFGITAIIEIYFNNCTYKFVICSYNK